ncbi:c-type cytochrome [Shewanella sp.]|nr:c-type cytochrome [Shewanella sp.]
MKKMSAYKNKILVSLTLGSSFLFSTPVLANNLDYILERQLRYHGVTPVVAPDKNPPALVELGRNLFFDKEISGRRNMSCATCHSVGFGTADAQSQSRGQGAIGLGPYRRQDGNAFFQFLPRNTLSLWNRGVAEWTTMFWDGRLEGSAETGFVSPAGDDMPQNFSSALAAFSIFPITPDEEMRGFPGQLDIFGQPNEMALLENDDFTEIWPLVTARVTDLPAYDGMLKKAFPGTPESALDITHISEAIGAFMSDEFTALNSPFDRYLEGDRSALSDQAKRGALLFYGRANCASCHSGGLQTDLDFHNIAAPQVGTGRGEAAPLDLGRGAITNDPADNFKFRTPSLRNIELEAPYFHNGAYAKLEDAVRHHLNPLKALKTYDATQIEPELSGLFQNDPLTLSQIFLNISPELNVQGGQLSERDIQDILSFLSSLTDPSSINRNEAVPDKVPSGLKLAS